MEAKNLRIGNYLLTDYDYLVEVELIHKKHFDCRELTTGKFCLNGKYKPIPLTKHWLLKFGFYQEEINDSWNIDTEQDIFALDSCLEFINYEHSPLDYVHELQNLFFAITGEELELKDES